MAKTVFITGSSGFIGSNLAKRILTTEPDTKVIGLDNMNDYYDVRIKEEFGIIRGCLTRFGIRM